MKTFYLLLVNSFFSATSVMLVWFSLTLWVYVQTQSVLATSIMSGIYLVATALTSIWFGSLVDHHKKKTMMIISSAISLVAFIIGFILYLTLPPSTFTSHSSPGLWAMVTVIFAGVLVANIRNIALPTVTTLLVEEEHRDKANGLIGTITGVTFLISSVVSGFLLASSGLYWILMMVIALLAISIVHLFTMTIKEDKIVHVEGQEAGPASKVDLVGTFKVIKNIPGLLPLILFTCFNNFLGGVFMPLMDAYGLSLVSLQIWGTIWGFLSLGFIIGGLFIAKKGLGVNPLRTLLLVNLVLWTDCIFFTIQPSIVLLCVGMFVYICLVPFIEACEHTVIQKIVPQERQGRVFGFAQSIEMAASPLTAFAIGPIAQFFFIPFMTTGKGVELIGSWFGTGAGRGIALVFMTAGAIGLVVTLGALKSRAYKLLSTRYAE